MIDVKRKVLFVHVPKTGGTTIGCLLHPRSSYSRILFGQREQWADHRTVWEYARDHDLAGYFKFAFVRNPWDWAYSGYTFALRMTGLGSPRHSPILSMASFNDFLKSVDDLRHASPGDFHAKCQTDYMAPYVMDFVGRFERFERDVRYVFHRIRLPLAEIPVLNKSSPAVDYRRFYTDETRDLVARMYARDISTFGYRFDPDVGVGNPTS